MERPIYSDIRMLALFATMSPLFYTGKTHIVLLEGAADKRKPGKTKTIYL
jgi:hypothetical protein